MLFFYLIVDIVRGRLVVVPIGWQSVVTVFWMEMSEGLNLANIDAIVRLNCAIVCNEGNSGNFH